MTHGGERGGRLLAATALALATAAALAIKPGSFVLPLLPSVLATLLWILSRAPLRNAALLALLAALLIDSPQEHPYAGLWHAPWTRVGEILYLNLNTSVGLSALHFALLDVLVLSGAAVALWRIASRRGPAVSPRFQMQLLLLCSAGVVLIGAWGLLRGGDFQQVLWQTRQLLYLPLLTLLFQAALAPRDYRALGAVVLAAAFTKAALAIYVLEAVAKPKGLDPPYLTTHSDSILFVTGLLVLGVACYQLRDRARWLLLLIGGPLLMVAIEINGRRVAYMALAAAALAVFAILPRSRLKRGLTRLAIMALPLFALYAGAGWHSASPLFAPLNAFRTVSEDKDRSAELRDIEDYNLVYSLRQHPLLGLGFGHEYGELIVVTDIAKIFPQYKFIPHNSVLGLWAFAGLLGFTAIWLPVCAGIFLATRAARRAARPEHVAAAVLVVGAALAYALLGWGDMGLQSTECTFVLAAALGVASRLSVETGAWPVTPMAASLGAARCTA